MVYSELLFGVHCILSLSCDHSRHELSARDLVEGSYVKEWKYIFVNNLSYVNLFSILCRR